MTSSDGFGRLDVLVLNASGGLERGADPGYAMRLNCDAQVRLARLALPLMPPGGRIVFVTSHQAHFHGRKPVPADYFPSPPASRPARTHCVQCGPILRGERHYVRRGVRRHDRGTITVRLFERRDPEAVAARRAVAPIADRVGVRTCDRSRHPRARSGWPDHLCRWPGLSGLAGIVRIRLAAPPLRITLYM